ncbi:MAG TPA: ATP-binding protein [Solirubrobacterales bacterium]|jgi:two-component system sensor histidine kinase KdpD
MELSTPLLLREPPRSRSLGILASVGSVALCTAAIYPLKSIAPDVSLGVVYLIGVIGVSIFWGFGLGLFTALLSAAAFNFFHIPPTGQFTIQDSENWVALGAFLIAAALVSSLAELGRARAAEADLRRREADLMAELARVLLGRPSVDAALPVAAERIATALELPSAALQLGEAPDHPERLALPLSRDDQRIGTLVVPAGIDSDSLDRVRERLVPGLEALLAAAIDREALIGATVETEALRRSDDIKTALLRTVSHDLRTPLTAIRAAAEALSSPTITEEDRQELRDAIVEDSERLASLVDNLLDLSRLRTGTAEPSRDWTSIEEVIEAALDDLQLERDRFKLSIDERLPFIRADSAQLERAFVNLLSNAARYSGEAPVSVRAREVSGRLVIRVVDQGPGIPERELGRIFEAFYRGSSSDSHAGAGLGLAIVRGFVEANGGQVSVESLPGQGTAFVVEFPLGGDAGHDETQPTSAAPAAT